MNTKHMWAPILGVVLGSTVVSAHAQIFKWVDERGVTQYSDSPPNNARETEKLDIATTGYSSPTASETCQTIRCQYERLRNDRLADEKQAQINAQSRASVITLQAPAALLSQPAFRYGPRWIDYGRVGGFRRWVPAPFGHSPLPRNPAPQDTGTSLSLPWEQH